MSTTKPTSNPISEPTSNPTSKPTSKPASNSPAAAISFVASRSLAPALATEPARRDGKQRTPRQSVTK